MWGVCIEVFESSEIYECCSLVDTLLWDQNIKNTGNNVWILYWCLYRAPNFYYSK